MCYKSPLVLPAKKSVYTRVVLCPMPFFPLILQVVHDVVSYRMSDDILGLHLTVLDATRLVLVWYQFNGPLPSTQGPR